jgi:hypothetical protein
MLGIEVVRVLSILLAVGTVCRFAVLAFFTKGKRDDQDQGFQAHRLCSLPSLAFAGCSPAHLLCAWSGNAWFELMGRFSTFPLTEPSFRKLPLCHSS